MACYHRLLALPDPRHRLCPRAVQGDDSDGISFDARRPPDRAARRVVGRSRCALTTSTVSKDVCHERIEGVLRVDKRRSRAAVEGHISLDLSERGRGLVDGGISTAAAADLIGNSATRIYPQGHAL